MRKSVLVTAVYVVALILLWVYAGGAEMENRGFVTAGYGITWGVLLWYAFRLEARGQTTARAVGSFEAVDDGD